MFESIRGFVRRHRRKFIVGGVVVGGAWLAGKYMQWKLAEVETQAADERLAHQRMRHHFESNQATCNTTVLSLMPALKAQLMLLLDSEAITAKLRSQQGNKLQMWENLKIISFTRTVSGVYAVVLLVVLMRVQLNIIGRHMYVDSQLHGSASSGGGGGGGGGRSRSYHSGGAADGAGEGPTTASVATEVQKDYLMFSQYLLQVGLARLVELVRERAEQLLGDVSLKKLFSIDDVCSTLELLRGVEGRGRVGGHAGAEDACMEQLLGCMFPSEAEEVEVVRGVYGEAEARHKLNDPALRRILAETRELVDSEDLVVVVRLALDHTFTLLGKNVEPFFSDEGLLPLAKVIPIVNGQIHALAKPSANEFVESLAELPEVEEFSAIVYSAFAQLSHDNGDRPALSSLAGN